MMNYVKKVNLSKKKKAVLLTFTFFAVLFLFLFFSRVMIFSDDDTSWYINNSTLLTRNGIIKDALRWIGWSLLKVLNTFTVAAETLFDSTFGLVDFTNSGGIALFIDKFRVVLVALTVLSVLILGIMIMMRGEKKPPIIRNICLGILAVSCSGYLFSTANTLIKELKTGILETSNTEAQSYSILDSNFVDLIANSNNISSVNYDAGSGIVRQRIKTGKDLDQIEINDWVDWEDGQDEFDWSDEFNEKMKYYIDTNSDGDLLKVEVDSGFFDTGIGADFYYRYYFDFWTAILQLGGLIVVLLALSYKNVRVMFELVVGRLLAYLFASDISNGERLKQILIFIRDTYITLGVSVLCLRLYSIITAALNTEEFLLTGIAKGLVCIFIAFAVIDGPNLVVRVLGIDAGLKSSIGTVAVIAKSGRSAAGTVTRTAKGGARGIKNTAMTAATGTTQRERSMRGTTAERIGGVLRKKADSKDTGSNNNPRGGGYGGSFGASSGMSTGSSSGGGTADNPTDGKNFSADLSGDNVNTYSSAPASSGGKDNSKTEESKSGFSTDFMDVKSSDMRSADSTDLRKHNSSSVKPSFETGRTKKEYKNPEFTNLNKSLKPPKNAPREERADYNKQVQHIMRSKNHSPIPPGKDAKEYQIKNYSKALQLEQAYKKYKPQGEDIKGKES